MQWYHGGMQAMTVRLEDELYERLREVSFRTRQPMSKLISALLLAGLPFAEGQAIRSDDGNAAG